MPRRLRSILSLVGAVAVGRMIRYEIAEHSMLPTLSPGDWTAGVRRPRRLAVGDIVVFDHPDRPGFALVKRITAVDDDRVTVHGDAPGVDSSRFGPIPRHAVSTRLVLRYRPLPLRLL